MVETIVRSCLSRYVKGWDGENYFFLKVTKIMGSIFGHRIAYNGLGDLKGQWHIPSKN